MASNDIGIRITATDQASAVFGNIQRNLGGLLAGFVSIGTAVESLRGALQLGNDLKTMADTTGVAVGKLDQLAIVAKLNDASLSDMAKSWKFLGATMIETLTATSTSAKLFTALGVSAKDAQGNLRGTDAVMGDVAKALNSIDNETVRAAAGVAIFGKSYTAIAAALRNYEKDQAAANRVIEQYGAVSQVAADLSDDLGDKFTMLGEGSKRALLGALVPGMAAVTTGMDELINSGGAFQKGFGQVVGFVAKELTQAFIGLKASFEAAGTAIGALFAAIATRSMEPLQGLKGTFDEIEKRRAESAKNVEDAYNGMVAPTNAAAAAQDRLNKKQIDAAAIARLLAPAVGAAKAANEEQAKFINAILDEIATLGLDADAILKYKAAKLGLVDATAGEREELASLRAELQKEKEAREAVADGYEKLDAWMKKDAESRDKAIVDSDKIVQNLQFEAKALTMTAAEREKAVALQSLLANKINLSTEAYDNYAKAISDAVDTKQALQQQIDLWQGIETAAHDAFLHIWESGKSVLDRLAQTLKSGLLELLYQMTVKKWIIQLSVGGAAGGAAGLANASGGSAANILGALGNLGSSIPSSVAGGASSIFGASGFTAGLAGDAFMPGALAGGMDMAAFGSAMAPVMAALPYVAIAAIAIPAIIKLFDKGPANRTATFTSGPASLVPDASRDAVFQGKSAFGAFGIAKDFWLGPEAGAAFKPVIDAITSMDNTIAGIVGPGMAQTIADALAQHSVTVGMGTEGTDINASGGPAAILKDRYVTVLNAIDTSLGDLVQGFEGTGDALATFVVGLVNLHESMAKFDFVKTFGESFGIDKLKELAGDGGDVAATFAHLVEVFQVTNLAADLFGQDFTTAFGSVGLASKDAREEMVKFAGGAQALASALASYYQEFFTDAERTQRATESVTASFVGLQEQFPDLIKTIPQTREAFRALVEGLDLTTEAGRQLAAILVTQLSPQFAAAHPIEQPAAVQAPVEIKQATEAVKDWSDTIAHLEIDKLRALGLTEEALAKERALQLASLADAPQRVRDLTVEIWALQDASDAAAAAQRAEDDRLAKHYQLMEAAGHITTQWTASIVAASNAMNEFVGTVMQSVADGIAQARKDATDAYGRVVELRDALRGFARELGGNIGSPDQSYAAAKTRLETAPLEGIIQAGKDFVAASAKSAASSLQYRIDVLRAMNVAEEGAVVADNTLSVAEQQLRFLQKQVEQLGTVNSSILALNYAVTRYLSQVSQQGKIAAALRDTPLPGVPDGGAVTIQPVVKAPSAAVPGEAGNEVAALLRTLVEESRTANATIARNTARTAKILTQFDGDGLPAERVL